MELVWPAERYLHSYVWALARGWSPDNVLGAAAARRELEEIAADPKRFVASLVDREAKGGPVSLPDGTEVPRLPGYRRWMWDGEFCGSIGFRWQPRTGELPPYVPGHIGFGVVPWKRKRGYAKRALALLLEDARAEGLPYVELTTDPDNVASQKVITANGGVFVERFSRTAHYGASNAVRFRIVL